MITESFDPTREAVLEPGRLVSPVEGFPRVGVSCFSRVLLDLLLRQFPARELGAVETANQRFPVYEITVGNRRFAAYLSAVGAPVCAAQWEEVTAMGLESLVLFGTCGVLDGSIADCAILLPTAAVRDEGVSYHYLPASEEVPVNPRYREEFRALLRERGLSWHEGKVWTTDAIYRETRENLRRRRAAGCLCVDMEAAAMAAVAAFRQKTVFQFFYAADNLDADCWEERSLANEAKLEVKEALWELVLAFAAVLQDREGA